jgi:hypothetical protein
MGEVVSETRIKDSKVHGSLVTYRREMGKGGDVMVIVGREKKKMLQNGFFENVVMSYDVYNMALLVNDEIKTDIGKLLTSSN